MGPRRSATPEHNMTDQISQMRLTLIVIGAVLTLAGGGPAFSAPMATEAEQMRVDRVTNLPDVAPSDRINLLLASRDFNDAELFALASTHPIIVEHFIPGDLQLAKNYLFSLAGAELHKMRTGGTLIRPSRRLSAKEKVALKALSNEFGVEHEKLSGVKIGPKEGRNYTLELTYQIKRKKTATYDVEFVPPHTPERDEASRDKLTRHFTARPSRVGRGVGSALTIRDSSFENKYSLADGWRVEQGRVLGAPVPLQEVTLDDRNSIDGTQSVRFYATDRTRVFQNVVQEVKVQPGAIGRLRLQHKADNVRVEFQQHRSDFAVRLTYLYNGSPVAEPVSKQGRLGSHGWEMLEIESVTPANANEVRIELMCSLSGTGWFDALVFEVINGTNQW